MTIEEKYSLYEEILRDWNARMNLVSAGTLNDIRNRHIMDSVQLADHLPRATVIDLGSGAGFPAVVLAIIGIEVIAVESVGKKCAFLSELKSRLNLPNLTIVNDRIENFIKTIKSRSSKVVFTARAFAPLIKILSLTAGIPAEYALLKGASADEEVKVARLEYDFDCESFPSKTGPGYILVIKNARKKPAFSSKTPGKSRK